MAGFCYFYTRHIVKQNIFDQLEIAADKLQKQVQILLEGKKRYGNIEFFTIGVLGYPNVGKSSLINAMKGKRSAPTSSTSGFTKGVQKIRADNKLVFLDTPGVIPYKEKDSSKHVFIGTIDFNRAKDPEKIVVDLMEKYPRQIEEHYGIKLSPDFEHSIEMIAKKRNLLMKQNKPDTERASRMILKDWQTGKIQLSVDKYCFKRENFIK